MYEIYKLLLPEVLYIFCYRDACSLDNVMQRVGKTYTLEEAELHSSKHVRWLSMFLQSSLPYHYDQWLHVCRISD